jgi:stromal membrane-associated protein
MDSFIRSKYETRRWALDGPPPSDPAILEDSSATVPAPVSEPLSGAPQPPQSQGHSRTSSSFTRTTPTPPVNRQPQHHQLLSTTVAGRTAPTVAPLIPGPGQAQQAQTPQKVPEPENDLFSLDFHAASANSGLVQQLQPKKDMKDDILSLFSTPAQGNAAAENSNGWGHFQSSPPSSAMAPSAPWGAPNAQHQASTIGTGGHGAWGPSSPAQASSVGGVGSWGGSSSSQHMQLKPTNMMGPNGSGLRNAPPAQQVQQPQVMSMIGANGAGAWGTSSGWTAPAPPAQGNLWGTTATTAPVQQQPDLFGSNVWGSSSDGGGLGNGGMSGGSGMWGASTGGGGAGEVRQKKDDVFGDLWGGFK